MSDDELLDMEPEDLAIPEGDDTVQADVSTETQETAPVVDEAKVQIEAAQKAAAEKAFKLRESERKQEVLEKRLAELERSTQSARPEVPAVPSKYDYDDDDRYYAALNERDEKLKAQAAFDTLRQGEARQREQAQREAQQAEQNRITEKAHAYQTNSVKLGVDQAQLAQAANVVQNYGLDMGLVEMILDDEQGPLITQYLGSNPLELDAIARMNPYHAAAKIATDIKSKASAMQPKTTQAPDPAPVLDGGGIPPKTRGPAGATFE